MGHFKSLLDFEIGNRQKMTDCPGYIHLSPKWPFPVSNYGSELAKFRAKSGHQEETGGVAGNGPFLIAIGVRNGPSSEMSDCPRFYQNFGGSWPTHLPPKRQFCDI